MYNTTDDDLQIQANATHPGFIITCRKCGSTKVIVDSDLGFSSISGQWGGVYLECLDCKTYDTIYGDY
jgi:hypothetical protein